MAEVYDFQTNDKAKIEQANQLMEKGYIDQAICLLERFLENVKDQKIQCTVKKELMTAYLLKGEFETCEALILEIIAANGLDLTVAAHDILVEMFCSSDDTACEKQSIYSQKLGLTALTSKNLIELVYQLKTYYEGYWYEAVHKKLTALKESSSFETQLMVLSDLQAVDSVQLRLFKAEFETILMTKLHPIIKTLIFELLGQKGMDCLVTFETNQMTRQLRSHQQDLAKYYDRLDEMSRVLLELDINEEMRALLHQHLIFFYQFHFPFIEEVNLYEVIEVFAQVLLGIELQFDKSLIPADDSNLIEIEVTDLVNSYLRSLSSLM